MEFAAAVELVVSGLKGRNVELLRPDELERIERDHPAGLSAQAIVELFATRSVRLSEATFRKYVQVGLLPRSTRVGRKGKHQGSQGIYPVESVRRINAIKKMMAAGLTIEDIKASFVVFKNHLDLAERELVSVFDGFEAQIDGKDWAERHRKEMASQLRALRVRARELLTEVARLGSTVTARAGTAVEV
jgi:DNA-binding transcriptional MerR regulator